MDKNNTKQNFYQLTPGKKFRQYRIDGVIGQGAMGVVYKVFDQHLQRHVALKVLQSTFIGEKEHKQFVREVKAIANLNHDNIVKLFEVGTEPTHYFTMEYIEGETLAQVIANENLSHAAIVRIVSKIALGLYHAHVKGIIHGDIKPDNIMITRDREPKIMDFGLAKDNNSSQVSQSGIQGTPAYLAPEQLQNKKVDKRVDIYALGVTLYRSLVGKLPFTEKNYVSLFFQIINETPQKLRSIDSSIPSDLELICEKCMAKSPQKRYANARFLARDLQNFLVGRPLWAESSSKVLHFIKRDNLFWIPEAVVVLVAILYWCSFWLSDPQIDSVYDKYNKKDIQVLTWYDNSSQENALYNLKLLTIRYGYESHLDWQGKAHGIVEKIYLQIQNAGQSPQTIDIVYDYLQTIIEACVSGFITDKKFYFNEVCNQGIRIAKKHKLVDDQNKLKEFQKIYELHAKFEEMNNELENIKNEKEKKKQEYSLKRRVMVDEIAQHITNPYLYLHLANLDVVQTWRCEEFLLKAVRLGDNYRFYDRLHQYYLNHFLYEEAAILSRKTIAKSPSSVMGHYNLARTLIFEEKYREALLHLDFIEKNYFNLQKELMYFEKVHLFVRQKKRKEAIKSLENAKKWHENYGGVPDFNVRYKIWQQAIKHMHDENFAIAPDKAAEFYFRMGKIEKAYTYTEGLKNPFLCFAIYREILDKRFREFDSADKIWLKAYNYAIEHLRSKAFDVRAAAYRHAMLFLSTAYNKIQHRKYINSTLHKVREAYTEFSDYYFAHFYKARFEKANNRYEEVVVLCNKAKNLAPWYKEEIELLQKICFLRWLNYHEEKGMTLEQKRHRVSVAHKLAVNMARNNNYAPAHNFLQYIYLHNKFYENVDKAIYHSQKIQPELLPVIHLFDFYYDRALLYAKQKMYDKAIEDMEKCKKITPDSELAINSLKNFRAQKQRQKKR